MHVFICWWASLGSKVGIEGGVTELLRQIGSHNLRPLRATAAPTGGEGVPPGNGTKKAKDGPEQPRPALGGPRSGSAPLCGGLGAHGTQLGRRSTLRRPLVRFGVRFGRNWAGSASKRKNGRIPDSPDRDSEGTFPQCSPPVMVASTSRAKRARMTPYRAALAGGGGWVPDPPLHERFCLQ